MNSLYRRLSVLKARTQTLLLSMPSLFLSLMMTILSQTTLAADPPPLTHQFTEITPRLPMADLKLYDMDEEIFDIKTMKGKVLIVNFWATWCPPCRREMTSLEKLYLATKDNHVVVVAVNMGEDIETVFSFINSIEPSPSFPIVFDTDSSVMEQWKVVGLPTTYIVDKKGKVAYKAIGGREFDHPDILRKVSTLSDEAY